jgi:hypothetical protein
MKHLKVLTRQEKDIQKINALKFDEKTYLRRIHNRCTMATTINIGRHCRQVFAITGEQVTKYSIQMSSECYTCTDGVSVRNVPSANQPISHIANPLKDRIRY